MKKIYFTVPNGKGWIHKYVHFACLNILRDQRYKIRHDCPTHTPYVHNLHKCQEDFLAGGEDYWLSMDDDNPPIGNPLDLVEQDLDVVGFPTPVWHNTVTGDRPWYLNALRAVDGGWKPVEGPTKGLVEVDAVGSGCLLIARRVMEAFKDEGPFMRKWEKGLVEIGGDFNFCQRAKEKGFKIWADFDRPCRHFNEIELLEVVNAFGVMKT